MRILIGYDASGGARAAIADLGRAGLPHDVDALVLSVADAVPPTARSDDATTGARVERLAYHVALDDAAGWADEGRLLLQHSEPSWKVDSESRADSPTWTLLQRAETWDADLLVVGSTGRSALGRKVFGSVAEKVLHQAPCAVRIGRGRPASERPGGERLVVGVDGSPGSQAAVSAVLLRKWAFGSAVRVVTAVNPSALSASARFGASHETPLAWLRTLNEIAVEKLTAAGLDAVQVLVEGDATRTLLEDAESWSADCVFIGAHGWHGMERGLVGSVATAVAVRASCSVEIVRPVTAADAPAATRPATASATE